MPILHNSIEVANLTKQSFFHIFNSIFIFTTITAITTTTITASNNSFLIFLLFKHEKIK